MLTTNNEFGIHQGQRVALYTLENTNGMQVKITNYGATITSISVLHSDGKRKELACGFDTLDGYFGEDYKANAPYFGCTVGRFASRIKDGKFNIDGQEYTLAVNNGSNHLHGGLVGFDKKIWQAASNENGSVSMSLTSPHMEEGYPGEVHIKVTFKLTDDNEIVIQYEATTDRTTPLSLTNHTYFNLSGFEQSIENHITQIDAAEFLQPDEDNVPVGEVAKVDGTATDLRENKRLGDCFEQMETGFEHYYTFDKAADELAKVATFKDSESGRTLEVSTTEPGALFYTGYFTSDKLQRENGDQYGRYRAFCFETSRYPNGPNLEDQGGAITQAGETYQSTTIFKIQ
ncbi:MAG: aldose epimerase family protein [Bacteroidota bacterium]